MSQSTTTEARVPTTAAGTIRLTAAQAIPATRRRSTACETVAAGG